MTTEPVIPTSAVRSTCLLSVIKLDKSITKIEKNTRLYSIGENTVRMIKDMNMQIVVEGIEDERTLQLFEDMGCDFIQGFYFSKPLPEGGVY